MNGRFLIAACLLLTASSGCILNNLSLHPQKAVPRPSPSPSPSPKPAAIAAADASSALEQAKTLVGNYTGHWETYTPEETGEVLASSWNDTVEAANPTLENGRAFVTVKSSMNFTYPKQYPYTMIFSEGFLVNSDGSAGKHFYDYGAGPVIVEQVSTDTWSIRSPVNLPDYQSVGITKDNVIFASNHVTKTVTSDGGMEIQRVTQSTTLVWKDSNGEIQSRQFVSLSGIHKRPITSKVPETIYYRAGH